MLKAVFPLAETGQKRQSNFSDGDKKLAFKVDISSKIDHEQFI
jgi:hypothetical protein